MMTKTSLLDGGLEKGERERPFVVAMGEKGKE
jgi:hypothetical protein